MPALGFGPSLNVGAAPRVGFDFAAGVLPPGASLARASAGSRFDAAGVLRIEPGDVARFDHDPATGALRGLLIEPERTNEVLMSEAPGDAAWSTTGAPSITKSGVPAPDGISSADRIADTATDSYGSIAQTFAEPTARALSVFVGKDAIGRAARFVVFRGGPALSDLALDTATGEVHPVGSGIIGGAAEDCGAFWRLVLVQGPTSDRINLYPAAGADAAWTYGTGATGSAVIWGLQAERGTGATSYVPTTGAPAMRAADVLTLDWGRFGVAAGPIALRYTFDDGSVEEREALVSEGCTTVPTTLARRWIRRIERR